MKKHALLCAVFILLGIAACKKEKSSTPVTPATPKIKTLATLTASAYTDTLTFVYDASGRIASVTRSDGYTKIMNFTADKAIYSYYPSPGVLAGTETFFLNADQRADSLLSVFGASITHTKYTYDSDGHMIIGKVYDNTNAFTHTYNYIWENGNQRERYNTSPAAVYLDHIVYDRVPDHKNTAGNQNKGLDLLGVDSQNPAASDITSYPPSGVSLRNYTYTYDDQGRIASMTVYTNTGSFSYSETYTYY